MARLAAQQGNAEIVIAQCSAAVYGAGCETSAQRSNNLLCSITLAALLEGRISA